MYREVIVEHGRSPANNYRPDKFSRTKEIFNPLCGDRIVLYVNIVDNLIESICFTGEGCLLCIASASMMTECIKGKTADEARGIHSSFMKMIEDGDDENSGLPEKLEAFSVVSEFPGRKECVTLAWTSLEGVL